MNSNRKFTIIELLMAIALTVVIGLIINQAFYHTQVASQRATATLNYFTQGRAVMDLMAQDIGNMIVGSVSPSVSPALQPYTTISFKTLLPVQRTHFQDPDSYTSDTDVNKAGYYTHNLAQVMWDYTKETTTTPGFLVRRISTPAYVRTHAPNSVLTDTNINSTTTASEAYSATLLNGDIRKFELRVESGFTPITMDAYNVRFTLTNAPLTITTRDDALQNGYVWLEFSRIISVIK